MWKDKRLIELLDIEHPIIQAPMAGASTPQMAVAAANAGGMGSLGCAMQTVDQVTADMHQIRQHTNRAINLNFFVHQKPRVNPATATAAQDRLAGWYETLITIAMFGLLCLITYLFFKYSEKTVAFFGQRGLKIITRLMGLILAVMGTQMLLSGIAGAVDAYLGK